MKIALAQLNFHIGNFESNEQKVITSINSARAEGADLVIFSELAVCGYPPLDFLEFRDFISRCKNSILRIAEQTQGIAIIIGCPSENPNPRGKPLFNSAFFIEDGTIKNVVHKGLLPNYDVFDEYRYFEPGKNFEIIECKGKKIALTICEDLWDLNDHLYLINPMDELIRFSPDFMVNIAASPFSHQHHQERVEVLKRNTAKYNLPVIYVNQVGAQTQLIFDGGSLVMSAKGIIVEELDFFSEELKLVDFPFNGGEKQKNSSKSRIEKIHNALAFGIRDYFQKQNFSRAIVGLSGGIDSAVCFAIAAKALGRENIHGVLMPSQFSSGHSIEDATALAHNLGASSEIIPIEEIYKSILGTLPGHFKNIPPGLAEENLQARIRGILLMAYSNKFGYILLNTSNKSEISVGYGTLYGDLCGGLSVLGDVYKTEVYELARYINRDAVLIPVNSIEKPPSAELRPGQKDSDSLPEYDQLDKILHAYIELRKGPMDLLAMGFDQQLVTRTLKLVNTNEYKRAQTPPVLRVSQKAFGSGRRMPIVAKYLS